MTLYKFFRTIDEDDNKIKLDPIKKYPLYAFTKYKKVANEFAKTRKKDMFKMVVTKGLSNEEYEDFAQQYRGCALEYKTFESYVRSNKVTLEYDILCTTNEYNNVESFKDANLYIDDTFKYVNIDVFKKKSLNKLKKIDYENIYTIFIKSTEHFSPLSYGCNDSDFYLDDYAVDWDYDSLRLYIFIYRNLLNIDEFLKYVK